MSLNLYLMIDTGGPEPFCVWGDWSFTRDVDAMWVAALPSGQTLADFLEGKTAAQTLPDLRAAVSAMEGDPSTFQAMESGSRYGTHQVALSRLRALVEAASAHPLASWEVCR